MLDVRTASDMHAEHWPRTRECYTRHSSRGRMGPGGLPSLQNCVSGGAPLTGGFDSHAPSPRKMAESREKRGSAAGATSTVNSWCCTYFYPNSYPKTFVLRGKAAPTPRLRPTVAASIRASDPPCATHDRRATVRCPHGRGSYAPRCRLQPAVPGRAPPVE